MANGTTSLEIPFTGTITLSENNGVVSFAVNANGATTAPVRPTGTTAATSTPTASTVAPRPPAPSGVFNVTDYGAVGDGVADDTAAIVAALDAAGAVASSGNRQTVYLPAGTYKVMPTGTINMRIHTKAAGVWGLTSDNPSNTQVGDFHIYDVAPTSGVGTDGQRYINRNENKVYLKTSGTWAQESILFDGSGTGWTAGYLAPDNADGSDGDVYIQYWLPTVTPFKVTQAWNHVTIKGAGIAATKLLYRCWGDISPNDYSVSGETVLATQIPPRALYTGSSIRTSRTEFFLWDSDGTHAVTPLNGFHIEDLELDGNATIDNYNHGWYTYAQFLDQWDINMKGLTFTYGADGDVLDVQVKRVHAHNIRGEVFYAGGGMNKEILLEDCEIAYSKASTTSISGKMTARRCNVHHIYNGFENYAFDQYGHYTIVEDCTIDMTDRGSGYGVVYLGERGANTYLHVFRNTITHGTAGVFVDSFGDNIRIEDNNFVDANYAATFQDTGAYSGITRGFNSVNIENNTCTARMAGASALNFQLSVHPVTNWTITGNNFLKGSNDSKFAAVWSYNYLGAAENFSVVFSNNTTDSYYVNPTAGKHPDIDETNTVTDLRWIQLFPLTGSDYSFYPRGNHYIRQTSNESVAANLNMVPTVDKFNVFTFTVYIESWQGNCEATIPAAAWNSLSSDILMRDVVKHGGDVYRFTFNNVTDLWDITVEP